MFNAEKELKKWAPVLDHADAPAITDSYKKAVTAKLLENTEKAMREERAHSSYSLTEASLGTNTGSSEAGGGMPGQGNGFDPILISLIRRSMPNLIAYDVAGVQPMSGPTGLIFAMRSRFTNQSGDEALFNEADTTFSGKDAGGDNTLTNPFSDVNAGLGTVTQALSLIHI